MGLNLVVYDYRFFTQSDYRGDKRFDSSRHYEDRDFVAWLNAGNAIFKIIGTPEQLAEEQRFYDEARCRIGEPVLDESLEQRMERLGGATQREGLNVAILERPKDFVAARAWVRDYVHPFLEIWNRKRFEDVLDLLEVDENLWLYENW